MKARTAIGCIIALLILVLSFGSCKLAGVEIAERIDMFIDDLNNDRANAYTNFHSGLTDIYNEIKPAAFWDIDFLVGGTPYSISGLDDSDSNNVTGTITGPGTFGAGGTDGATFKMAEQDRDWYIEELSLTSSGNVVH